MTRASNLMSTQSHQSKVTDQLPFVDSPRAERPIVLKQLDIQVTVVGLFAETTQIMHFENSNNRNLEGNLTFPLPEGAVVCGYGLDVDGILVDGVVVPKQQARQILEAEERKGADPGLLEQVQGNIYQTRIYPIPARGKRIVKIVYTTDLTIVGNDGVYDLPLQHAKTVDQVSLRIEVQQAPLKPLISGGQGNVDMTTWRQAWVADAVLQPGLITEDLQIRLPDLPDTLQMVEKTSDGETFFCISHVLKEQAVQEEWRPKKITLAWDGSASRTSIEADLNFLQMLFTKWQDCLVDVLVFRNRLDEEVRSFTIRLGQCRELIDYLQALPYDGATDFSVLNLGHGLDEATEACLLFTDGLDTLQQGLPKLGGYPVYPVVSQTLRGGPFLQHIAEKSGGRFIDIGRFTLEEGCRQLCNIQERPLLLKSNECDDTSLTVQAGRINICGRLLGENGSLAIRLPGNGDLELNVEGKTAADGNIIARQWAGQKLQELSVSGDEKNGVAIDLARRYGIVSPGTSLLVLESLDQYLEYGVEPPESLPEMLAQFRAAKTSQRQQRKQEQKIHLESVVRLWQDRVSWWEKDFHTLYKYKPKNQETIRGVNENGVRDTSATSNRQRITNMEADEHICYSLDPLDFEVSMQRESPESASSACLEDFAMEESAEPSSPPQISAGPTITIKPWDPDKPYLDKIKKVEPAQQYSVFLEERKQYANSPAFILDCGDLFLSSNQTEIGLRVLSNLLEMQLQDVALMRIYAWRLQHAGELDEAIRMFEQVLKLRDDEPQSYRDLALALGERWEKGGNISDIRRAMELLYEVVSSEWERFPEIELIALMELNRLMDLAKQQKVKPPKNIDPRLCNLLDLDIRISLSWDADLTDVDLHVYEPNGDHASYQQKLTAIGGLVSRDVQDGYGPEEYVLKKAMPGTYAIKAHYFTSHQQILCGPCTVIVHVFTNYGRPDEKKEVLTLRLDESGNELLVGEINIEGEEPEEKKTPNLLPTIEDFRKIKPGMEMVQVVDLVGTPSKMDHDGDGVLRLVYNLPDKREIVVVIKNEVLAVRQIMNGAVIELL